MVEIYSQKLETLQKQGYRLLSPPEVSSFKEDKINFLAFSWSKTLDLIGGNNTFHPEPNLLVKLMLEQHASVIVDSGGNFISGAKIQPWGYNNNDPQQN